MPDVTSEEFRQWRAEMGWTADEAARQLGITARTISIYENDKRPDNKPVNIPPTVWLACQALKAGIRLPDNETINPVIQKLAALPDAIRQVGLELRKVAKNPENIAALEFDGQRFIAISRTQRRVPLSDNTLQVIWNNLSSRQE